MGRKKTINYKKLIGVSLGAVAILAVAFMLEKPKSESNDSVSKKDSTRAELVVDGDIVIPMDEVSEVARFYPAKIDGTDLEVIAVKASDGSIRSAFNTCQVCYSSGRGYYVQKEDRLECQNCGNLFSMDEVQVISGGCNPLPITDEYKTVTDSEIIIPKEVLSLATGIFANWK